MVLFENQLIDRSLSLNEFEVAEGILHTAVLYFDA